MIIAKKHIQVFEHQSLWINRGEEKLSSTQLFALQKFYGEKGVPYYSLIHNGIKFTSYVGVIQVGDTTIEILPKADKSEDKNKWKEVLLGMLNAVGVFKIHAPSSSALKLRNHSLLDLYFELFVKETELLVHQGLAKKYRKTEGNKTALKGNLQFAKQIQKNLVHKERFYVNHTIYDADHTLHQILYKALKLLNRINSNVALSSRLSSLLLDFPEMPDIAVNDALFERLNFNRKTERYRNAIEIARLLLLNYHPDLSNGQNNVLALMFDMNQLWEEFVYVSIRKYKDSTMKVSAQTTKYFWKPENGNRSKMIPDIVIHQDNQCFVLDTKWKNLNGKNPSPEDLRQMYVYADYFEANKVSLIYPGEEFTISSGKYYDSNQPGDRECSVMSLKVNRDIREWQKEIYNNVMEWCKLTSAEQI